MIAYLIFTFIMIGANVIVSYKGFKDFVFFEKYKFETDAILVNKQHYRIISSGFLHIDWIHLLFNMACLWAFAESLSIYMGFTTFLITYFGSLIGGNLLALYIHRNHGNYSAVGASGAVCGIVFASVACFPGMELGFLLLPIRLPAWIYALLFVAYTIYGIRTRRDNIGHEAHLGGALCGMFIALSFQPMLFTINYIPILVLLIPTLVFLWVIMYKPYLLYIEPRLFRATKRYHDQDHRYNSMRVERENDINVILEKINKRGINSLSAAEKRRLDDFSKK